MIFFFDYIVYAAGFLWIKSVAEFPLKTCNINIFGTKKILDFATKQKHLKRFILFSTSEIYSPDSIDMKEYDPAVIPNVGMH